MAAQAAGKYTADMQPMPISAPASVASAARARRADMRVIGESIFGNYIFSDEQIPEVVQMKADVTASPQFVPPPPTPDPAALTGFGATEVVPVRMRRGLRGFGAVAGRPALPVGPPRPVDAPEFPGYGLFGGRGRHGRYGMTRYGEPLRGFGLDLSPTNCSNANAGSVSYTKGATQDPSKCLYMGVYGSWPTAWDCNGPNFQAMLNNGYREACQTRGGKDFDIGRWMMEITTGAKSMPADWPKPTGGAYVNQRTNATGTAQTAAATITQALSQGIPITVAQAKSGVVPAAYVPPSGAAAPPVVAPDGSVIPSGASAFAGGTSNTGLYVGLGVAALAIGGALYWKFGMKKAA